MGKHRGVAEGASRSQSAGLCWDEPVWEEMNTVPGTTDGGREEGEDGYWPAGEPTHCSLELLQ